MEYLSEFFLIFEFLSEFFLSFSQSLDLFGFFQSFFRVFPECAGRGQCARHAPPRDFACCGARGRGGFEPSTAVCARASLWERSPWKTRQKGKNRFGASFFWGFVFGGALKNIPRKRAFARFLAIRNLGVLWSGGWGVACGVCQVMRFQPSMGPCTM